MKRLFALLFLGGFLLMLASCGSSTELQSANLLAFSETPGIYTSRFSLEITCSDPSLTVYYTKNGEIPTTEALLYSEDGIDIGYRSAGKEDPSSVNIIRAAAFDEEGKQVGSVLTGTYILSDSPSVRYSTMIVSIVSDPEGLYSYETGIMVKGKKNEEFKANRPSYWTTTLEDANYFGSGIEWEREASVEFFERDGTLMLSQDMGIRISGGWNRRNAHKSLRLFARYTYDDANVMRLDAYPGLTSLTGTPVTAYKTLILRTGSNNLGNTTIQTPFLMRLADGIGVDAMSYRPVCVYLNGEYYGFMALLEDYSTSYFEQNYHIPAEEITCINGAGYFSGGYAWQLDNGPEEELAEFQTMVDFIIESDMTDPACYAEAGKMLDLDNFIHYMCFEGYIGNSDWPQNNVRVWRRYPDGYSPDAEQYGYDGRWRFLLKDLDLAAGYGADGIGASMFKRLNSDDGLLRLNAIFKSLFQNEDFRNRVFCFVCDLLSTTMQLDHVMEILGEVAISAQQEMKYYIPSFGACGGSLSKWQNHLYTPYRFFKQRWTNVHKEIARSYGTDWGTLEVEIEGEGTVFLSSLTLNEAISLEYLQGLTLPVSAKAADGWQLAELTLNGDSIAEASSFTAEETMTLHVRFVLSESQERIPLLRINEIKYEYPRTSTECDYVEIWNASSQSVYLKGYRLLKESVREDGSADSDFWNFPAISLAPGEYTVLRFDKDVSNSSQDLLCVPHGLSAGDRLSLQDRSGKILDSVELPICNNEVSLARDESGWYFAPEATLGSENVRANGYLLSNVMNEKTRGTFMYDGRLIDDFAYEADGVLAITETNITQYFGKNAVKLRAEKLEACRVEGGFELNAALDALGYEAFYISSLDSYIIMKK